VPYADGFDGDFDLPRGGCAGNVGRSRGRGLAGVGFEVTSRTLMGSDEGNAARSRDSRVSNRDPDCRSFQINYPNRRMIGRGCRPSSSPGVGFGGGFVWLPNGGVSAGRLVGKEAAMPGGRVGWWFSGSGSGSTGSLGNESESGGPAGILVGRFFAGGTVAPCGGDQ